MFVLMCITVYFCASLCIYIFVHHCVFTFEYVCVYEHHRLCVRHCVCLHVYIYVFICITVSVCALLYVCGVCLHVCMFGFMCTTLCVCVRVCVCARACMHVCVTSSEPQSCILNLEEQHETVFTTILRLTNNKTTHFIHSRCFLVLGLSQLSLDIIQRILQIRNLAELALKVSTSPLKVIFQLVNTLFFVVKLKITLELWFFSKTTTTYNQKNVLLSLSPSLHVSLSPHLSPTLSLSPSFFPLLSQSHPAVDIIPVLPLLLWVVVAHAVGFSPLHSYYICLLTGEDFYTRVNLHVCFMYMAISLKKIKKSTKYSSPPPPPPHTHICHNWPLGCCGCVHPGKRWTGSRSCALSHHSVWPAKHTVTPSTTRPASRSQEVLLSKFISATGLWGNLSKQWV